MSNNALFITGTDTGVGKTFVAVSLVRALVSQGMKVRVLKPIETGCPQDEDGHLLPADALQLREASNGGQSREQVICAAFRSPVAPSVALRHEGDRFEIEDIVERIDSERERADLLVVEGAGGLLVPIKSGYPFADLCSDASLPLLIVVGSRLGALNQAALTFEVARRRKLPVIGYVLNEMIPPERSASEALVTSGETNRDELRRIARDYEMEELGFFQHGIAAIDSDRLHPELERLAKGVTAYFSAEE